MRLIRSGGENGEESFIALFNQLRSEGRGLIAVSAPHRQRRPARRLIRAEGLPTYGLADDSAYPELFEDDELRSGGAGRSSHPVAQPAPACSAPCVSRAILGLVVDWGYRSDGIPVRLFGEVDDAPRRPGNARRQDPGGDRSCCLPPAGRRDVHRDVTSPSRWPFGADHAPARDAAMADAIEDMISAAPEQWYSFKPVWPRRRPRKTSWRRVEEMANEQSAKPQ